MRCSKCNVQPRASVIEDELVGLAEEPNAGDYADARKTGNVEDDEFAITLRGDVGSSVGRHDGVGIRSAGFAGLGRVDDTGTKIEFFDDGMEQISMKLTESFWKLAARR